MGFAEAIKSGFGNYANFSGRARRSAYWFWVLFAVLVSIAASIIDTVVGTAPVLGGLVALGLLLPGLAVSVRRLHDTNRSGWWILIGLVPLIGFIVLIVFYVQDSEPTQNQYGPPPKALHGGM